MCPLRLSPYWLYGNSCTWDTERTVTHCGRIALWSHQSAQTASSERCIMRIVNAPQGDSPPNPRVLKLREQ